MTVLLLLTSLLFFCPPLIKIVYFAGLAAFYLEYWKISGTLFANQKNISLPLLYYPQPLITISPTTSKRSAILDCTYEWIHVAVFCVCCISLNIMISSSSLFLTVTGFHSFCDLTVFHYVNISHFLSLFISWSKLLFGFYEYYCSKFGHANAS